MVMADRQRGFACIDGKPYPIANMALRHGLLEISVIGVGPSEAVCTDRYTLHDSAGMAVATMVVGPSGVSVPPLNAHTDVTIILRMNITDNSTGAPHTT